MDAFACMDTAWRNISMYATERRTYSQTRERIAYKSRLYSDLTEQTFSLVRRVSADPGMKDALTEELGK